MKEAWQGFLLAPPKPDFYKDESDQAADRSLLSRRAQVALSGTQDGPRSPLAL